MINRNIFTKPSIYAHAINGFFILFAIIILVIQFSKLNNLDFYRLLSVVLLFSIAIGIHGLSHLGLETAYEFNPIQYGLYTNEDNYMNHHHMKPRYHMNPNCPYRNIHHKQLIE
jgi:hypothetical protein